MVVHVVEVCRYLLQCLLHRTFDVKTGDGLLFQLLGHVEAYLRRDDAAAVRNELDLCRNSTCVAASLYCHQLLPLGSLALFR